MTFFFVSFAVFFFVLNWRVWQGKRSLTWESLLFPLIAAAALALVKSFFRIYVMYQFLLLLLIGLVVLALYTAYRKYFAKGFKK